MASHSPLTDHLLSETEERLLADERQLLGELRETFAEFGAARDDLETLARSIEQLDELFLLVVAGEFNAGKSAFINALLGHSVAEEGVTPTTSRVQILRWGEAVGKQSQGALDSVTAPVELLRRVNIVDTPGTNAIQREHEEITRRFLPRSDLVLFITSADRPFTESERQFLESIREWGKKVVIVLNKVDLLTEPEDVDRVLDFIRDNARTLLDSEPEILPISARQAAKAKHAAEPEELEASGFVRLERYIAETLDDRERVRLKLANPLGVGRRLSQRYSAIVDERLDLLVDDLGAIDDIENQLGAYRDDLDREFRFRLADVENLLHQFEARGNEFFEDTLRLGRIVDLVNKSRIQAEFERKAVSDLPNEIGGKVDDLIDWMVAAELSQWQAVMEHVSRRKAAHADRIVGEVGGGFDSDRARRLATVGQAAQRSIETYDQRREAARMAQSVQGAVAGTALLELGAVGLGTAVAAVTTSTAIDVTGIIAAGAMAVLGLFVIPNKRRVAKKELKKTIDEMKSQLMSGLTGQFEREVDASVGRIRDAIAPYTRFVRAERESLETRRARWAELADQITALEGRIATL